MRHATRLVASAVIMAVVGGLTSAAQAQGKTELQIRKDKKGNYRFFYKSGAKTLAMCVRGYKTTSDAMKDIAAVKSMIGQTDSGKGGLSYKKDKKGKTRFYVKDAKGKTLAMSPKGYDSQTDAAKVVAQVKAIAAQKPKIKS